MKKIIFIFTAIISMMIYIASPLFIKPLKAFADYNLSNLTNPLEEILEEYESDNTIPSNRYTPNQMTINPANTITSDSYLLYFVTRHDHEDGHDIAYYPHTILVGFDSAYVTFENGLFTAENIVNGFFTDAQFYKNESSDSSFGSHEIKKCIIDFENKTFKFYDTSNNLIRDYYLNTYPCTDIWDIQSNIESMSMPSLNLSISFTPTMSGSVSRSGTLSGHSIEYKYLEMQVNNNGDNAQFAMFIVPSGQNISFPADLLNTPQGFIGFPTFAYITDEWIDWTNGATNISGWLNTGSTGIGIDMQMLYSPCAWRTITQGSQRTYRINWDMMKLNKDTSYDIVVYGMVNPTPVNASSTGTGLGCWTVMSSLSDVQEVYRSTFNIIDPVAFNADSIDEGNAAHPWNPDIDNTSMFNKGNVYKDTNGNYVIKGSSGSGSGSGGSFYDGFPNYASLNNMFGGFFGFLNSALNAFPSIFLTIITLGLTGIIIVGIVKVAFK